MSAFSHLSGFQKVQFALFRDQTGLVAAISQTVSLMNAQRTKKPRTIAGIAGALRGRNHRQAAQTSKIRIVSLKSAKLGFLKVLAVNLNDIRQPENSQAQQPTIAKPQPDSRPAFN
jgi:hypothetical protein